MPDMMTSWKKNMLEPKGERGGGRRRGEEEGGKRERELLRVVYPVGPQAGVAVSGF